MVTKNKVTKTIVSKKAVKTNKKVNNESKENKSLEEFTDNTTLEEDLKEISKAVEAVEEVKKEDEKKKNHNLFQTMKNIIWF